MKKHRLKSAAFAAFAALALCANAALGQAITSLDDIQYWVGSGANRAGLVIDWNDGQSTTSYAWGYRWDGAATGEDMLRAIAGFIGTDTTAATANASGDSALSLYTIFYTGLGNAIFELDYQSHAEGGFEGDSSGYWSYYVANGASTYPGTWGYSEVGMGDRALSNNSWDGWSWAADFSDVSPGAAIAAVPEPAIFALLALGGTVLVLCSRRKRHA